MDLDYLTASNLYVVVIKRQHLHHESEIIGWYTSVDEAEIDISWEITYAPKDCEFWIEEDVHPRDLPLKMQYEVLEYIESL